MKIKIGLTEGATNTQYAPLAALLAHYQARAMFQPLAELGVKQKKRDFTPGDKLLQCLVSILAGCESQIDINTRLKHEYALAQAGGWERFADQSGIARTLDRLTQKQIMQLRQATTRIWRNCSLTYQHDWRGYLWLDFDLSGLPCGKHAENSMKGYFSGKKTLRDAN